VARYLIKLKDKFCEWSTIADAQSRGDFYVTLGGLGFVHRRAEWLRKHSRYARHAGPNCCEQS
jgi:hypothetical protein